MKSKMGTACHWRIKVLEDNACPFRENYRNFYVMFLDGISHGPESIQCMRSFRLVFEVIIVD